MPMGYDDGSNPFDPMVPVMVLLMVVMVIFAVLITKDKKDVTPKSNHEITTNSEVK